jgi:hypothetical protein
LHGTLKTDARLSQETRGIKSALLKLFDRLFKGKKAGAEIPLNVTGTYVNPLIQRRRIEQGQAPLG